MKLIKIALSACAGRCSQRSVAVLPSETSGLLEQLGELLKIKISPILCALWMGRKSS